MTALVKIRDECSDGLVSIGGERRGNRRYELQLDIRWKLLHRRRVLDSGIGRTRDISSHGILFETGRMLPAGSHLEIWVSWPALLHGVAPLKLTAAGVVIWSSGECTAIRMMRHEFRTVGILTERAAMPTGANSSIPLWNVRGAAGSIKLQ